MSDVSWSKRGVVGLMPTWLCAVWRPPRAPPMPILRRRRGQAQLSRAVPQATMRRRFHCGLIVFGACAAVAPACRDLSDAIGEIRQAGKGIVQLWSPAKPATAAQVPAAQLALPGCVGETCGPLCDQAALGKVFLTQTQSVSNGEVTCYTCVVNAVTLCDGKNGVDSTPLDAKIAERALDLLKLPPDGVDGVAGTLATSPIGRVE